VHTLLRGRANPEEFAGHRVDSRSHTAYNRQLALTLDTLGMLTGVAERSRTSVYTDTIPAKTRIWSLADIDFTFAEAVQQSVELLQQHFTRNPPLTPNLRLFLHTLRSEPDLDTCHLAETTSVEYYNDLLRNQSPLTATMKARLQMLEKLDKESTSRKTRASDIERSVLQFSSATLSSKFKAI
jgi:hypothetical protein